MEQNTPEFDILSWRIRAFKKTDLDLVKAASEDPYIPLVTSVPKQYSEEEGVAFIERQWSRHENGTGYSFAISQKDTDQAIGSFYIGLSEKDSGRASLGYWIIEPFRGQGAAKAILKEMAQWAWLELNIPRLELYVETWNIASIKTAEAAGFEQEGLMRSWQQVGEKREDMIMMSLIS